MKQKHLFITLVILGLFGLAFSFAQPQSTSIPNKTKVEPTKEIKEEQHLYQGNTLPHSIDPKQTMQLLQLSDGTRVVVVQKPSLNLPVPFPKDARSDFAGILIENTGTKTWQPFLSIQDDENGTSSNNNPYYFWDDGKYMYLTIVDINGAGSGEGIMKVFKSKKPYTKWELTDCRYYITNFTEPDFEKVLEETKNFEIFEKLEQTNCENDAQLLPWE